MQWVKHLIPDLRVLSSSLLGLHLGLHTGHGTYVKKKKIIITLVSNGSLSSPF